MSNDYFDPADAPVTRGRRDPELAHRLEAEELENDASEPDGGYFGLLPGDTLVAKVSIAAPTSLGDAWFTYGATTKVLETESEQDAFGRLADVVNTRVIDLASDATERVNTIANERSSRGNRIIPR